MRPETRHSELHDAVGDKTSSWYLPLSVFVLSLLMTIGVYLYLTRQAELNWRAELSRDAALITSEVRDRLRSHAQFLRGVRAFFAASDHVSPQEWAEFTAQLQLDRNIPGIQAYGFAPVVAPGQLEKFSAARRRDESGEAGAFFAIRPPATGFEQALPVSYIAPLTPLNKAALGFNLLSEARRREAVEMARDRDEIILSRRIELVFEDHMKERQPGFLMVLPVYRRNAPISTVEERRRAFIGVVVAGYRLRDFMQTLNYANSGLLSLRIFDDESFNTARTEASLSLLYDGGSHRDGRVTEIRELDFGQRNWQLRFTPNRTGPQDSAPLWMLFSGLMVSVMLGIASRIQSSYRERAESLARDMTVELRRSEERFKLAAEGTNDGIWDRDLEHGTVWHSERLRQLMGFPPDTDTANVDFFLSRIHPDDRPALEAALGKHLSDRKPYSVEYRFRKGNGEWAWFRSHGQGVWRNDGRAVRLVGSISDISEQKASEARVAHYRDFLLTVLKFIPHPVFVKNKKREYIAVNSAFCRLINRSESEILGRVEFDGPALDMTTARRIREMDDRVFAGAGEQVEEHLLPLRNGIHTVIARKALAVDPDGEPILIGTLTDISELRQAERERAEADRQRKSILDAATEVSIIATDTTGIITLFNRGAEKMLGYRADEVVGQKTPAIIHDPEEVAARGEFLSAELGLPVSGFEVFVAIPKQFGAENREWTYLRKDGGRISVGLVVTAVHDEAGEVTGFLGIATDITERKRTSAALEQQSLQMRTIIEHIPGGVSLIDSELRFIAANRQLLEVLDFPESLFVAGWPSLYEVALFNARRGDYGAGTPEELALQVVEKAKNPQPHRFERTRPNGRTIEVRGTPLPGGGFVTIYTDITERKAVEEELRRHRDHLRELVDEQTAELRAAKEAAEHASEAKSEFLANISHELRTPMHSVLSFATLGEERAKELGRDKLGHYFQRIHQSGSRLLSLLNNLLDMSKLEAGMMHLHLQAHDLRMLIEDAIGESEPWAHTRGVRVALVTSLDNTSASVDAVRFGQVIRNLLSNAIKFSPGGGQVVISLSEATLPRGRRATDPADIPAIRIEVTDEGIGIPEDELDSVFDKFFQSSKTKTGAGGTGLGLAICREIVLAHGGVIRAYNSPQGNGATLAITLPRHIPTST